MVDSIPPDHSITGGLKLSQNGNFAVFSAELKSFTKKSFFDEILEKDENVTYGQKFMSQQSWGEQMTKTYSRDFFWKTLFKYICFKS